MKLLAILSSVSSKSVWKRKVLYFVTAREQRDLAPPAPPPGAPSHPETRLSHLPDGRLNTYNGQSPNARYNNKGQRILPGGGGGARFIPPEEYKEFLQLGHGGIFDLDLDNIDVAPWRERGADVSSYFNYGLDERTWRKYAKSIRKSRLEQHLQNKIETYGIDSSVVDSELPIEVRKAIGGWEHARNTNVMKLHDAPRGHVVHSAAPRHDNTSVTVSDIRQNDEHVDDRFLLQLQKQVEELQKEYKRAIEDGTMTPQRNFQLQQHMLDIKRQMLHSSG